MGAKGNSNLRYTAQLSVKEAIANAKLLKKELGSMGIDVSKAFDSKPMTEYQKNLISLKKDVIDKKKVWQDLLEVEKQSKINSAQAKAEIDKLKIAEQEATNALKAKKITQEEYNLQQKKNFDAQRLAIAAQKESDRQTNQANKLLREQLTIQRQRDAQLERNRKKLQQESSEYYKLSQALIKVRTEAKDVLAEMFKMERQGHATGKGYQALKEKAEALTKQTNVLDNGIKKIDASLGLHQRNVGNYGLAIEGLNPHFAAINQKLAIFGTSIDQLAGKDGLAEFGTSIASVGKNILKFLISPVGLAVTALAALYGLFTGNKDTVIEFDNKLLNVGKTTNLAGRELTALGDDVITLSRKLKTVSTDQLLEYGTVAGQLGVKGRDNILAFSEALAKLETASNIKGEEGGSEIARLLTLTDGGVQNVKAFGDEIVNLGNNFAATEKEILSNAEQISQNTGLYRIGRQDVLAYATATKAVGLEAEVVGSAFNRTLSLFEKAIRTGNNLDVLSKQTGRSVEDLKSQFKDDASGIFNDFVGGLNKIDKSGGSVNEVLEKLGISAVRDQRVISTLATSGYGVLNDALETVRKASGALDQEFSTASGKLINQTKKFGIAWDNLVLSVENGQGVIGRASVGVVSFFTSIVDAITPSTQTYQYNAAEVEKLTSRYDELSVKLKMAGGVAKLSKADQEELKEVTSQLGTLLPGVTTKFDEYGNSIDISRSKVAKMTAAQRELIQAMNRSDINSANKDFKEAERRAIAQQKILEEVSGRVGTRQGFKTISPEDVLEQKDFLLRIKNDQYEAAKAVRAYGGELTAAQKKVIAFYETEKAVKKTVPKSKTSEDEIRDVVRTAGVIKAEIKKIQELQKPLDIASKAYADYALKIKTLKKELSDANGTYKSSGSNGESAIKARNTLQQEIDALNKKGINKQLSSDEQELTDVDAKYTKLIEKAKRFNEDKRNIEKGIRVDVGSLRAAQEVERTEIVYKQEAKELEKSLDEQAKLYAAFEELKSKIGIEKAEQRYAGQIETNKTYLDALYKQEEDMLNPGKAKGGAEDEVRNKQALKVLQERIKEQELIRQKSDDDMYARAYQAAMTAQQALLQIEADYHQDVKALGSQATDEQIANLDRRKREAIRSVNEENAFAKSGYAELMANFDAMTRQHVIEKLNIIKDGYQAEYAAGKLTAEQLANLVDPIDQQINGLNGSNPFNKIGTSIKNYKKILEDFPKDSIKAKRAQSEMFSAIAEGAEAASVGISGMADVFDQLGIGGEKLQGVMKGVSGVIGGAGEISKGIASGDPVAIVSGSIKLLSSAIDLFNGKDRKLNRKIEVYKEQLASLGKAYAKLERDVNNSVGDSYYSDSAAQIENLKRQQDQLIKAREAESQKKKSDKGKIDEYNSAIDEIPNKIEDIQAAISQNLIQGTFKELSTSLADALTSAFQAGEDGIAAMDKTLDAFIANAIKGGLRIALLEKPIKQFTDELAAYAKANNNSVIGFDFDKYKEELKKAGNLFNDALEGSKEFFEDVDSTNTGSSLQKGITQITTDQASALEGIMRGQYEQQKKLVISSGQTVSQLTTIGKSIGDLFQIARNNFEVTVRIEKNTADTVVELKNAVTELKGINKNTGNSGNSYRGAGFG